MMNVDELVRWDAAGRDQFSLDKCKTNLQPGSSAPSQLTNLQPALPHLLQHLPPPFVLPLFLALLQLLLAPLAPLGLGHPRRRLWDDMSILVPFRVVGDAVILIVPAV